MKLQTTFIDRAESDGIANSFFASEEDSHLVRQRGDLPTVPGDVEFEIFYVEKSLMGSVGRLLGATHSHIMFKKISKTPSIQCPDAMTLQV